MRGVRRPGHCSRGKSKCDDSVSDAGEIGQS